MHTKPAILIVLGFAHNSSGGLLPQQQAKHDSVSLLRTTFTYDDTWVESLVLPEPHDPQTLDYAAVVTKAIPGFFAIVSNVRGSNYPVNSSSILHTQVANVTTDSTTVTVVKETFVTVLASAPASAAPTSKAVAATITVTAAVERGDVHANRIGLRGGLGGLLKPLVGDLLKPGDKKKPGDEKPAEEKKPKEKKPDESKDEHSPPVTKTGFSVPDASKSAVQPASSKGDTSASMSKEHLGRSETGSAASKESESKTPGLSTSSPASSKSKDTPSTTEHASHDASSPGADLKSSIPTWPGPGTTKLSSSDKASAISAVSRDLSQDAPHSRHLTGPSVSSPTATEKREGNEVNIDVRPPMGIPTAVSKGAFLESSKPMLQSALPSGVAGPGKANSAGVPEDSNTALMIVGFVFLLVLCY
jgi:hypothetical protein